MFKDRYSLGLISGLCGGLTSMIVNLILILLFKFGSLRFLDFAGVFILGRLPHGVGETILAQIAFLGFATTLGVIFTHLVSLSRPYLLLKAIHFGMGTWFFSYAFTLLFKVPELANVSLSSALTNLLASAAYGLAMGLVLNHFRKGEPSS